ncbi:MAG: dihydrofolate reductase family protein [Leptospirillia bacterium]
MSPKFRVYIAVSEDGFIADKDGSVGWLDPYADGDFGFADFFAEIHTVVMGRTSFDQVRTFGDWPYKGKRSVVLTRRAATAPEGEDVVFVNADARAVAKRARQGVIEAASAGDIWVMGGADVIRQFMDCGCVDIFEIFVIPVRLGRGISLFADGEAGPGLPLAGERKYGGGVVGRVYRGRGR